jgi:hypothetical protein
LKHEADVGRITRLDVAPAWSQGPVSCRLLQEALGFCRHRGVLKVILAVDYQTRPALRLLRCMGFQPSRPDRGGRQRCREFYLNLYERIDQDRCRPAASPFSRDG